VSMPFYVSPEQLMKDRADFARKGIAKGRSVVAVQYADGVLFACENPSRALHKVSEIYDRIAFAAVGRSNEFENLRIAGVRLADMRGYAYDRRDVTARALATAYAQTLGTIFSSGGEKPYEVELFVAEVGDAAAEDQIYRLTYDGQVADVPGYAVMGGAVETVASFLETRFHEGLTLEEAIQLAVGALGHSDSEDRVIREADLEVAVLDRTRSQSRKFRRLRPAELQRMLGERGPAASAVPERAESAGSSSATSDDSSGPIASAPPATAPTPDGPTDPVAPSDPPISPPVDPQDPLA
jgi:proteasome alpha subunit